MEILRANSEEIGEKFIDFIKNFTESIDTFIVRSSAIFSVYCILALVISAILSKIEVLAIIALNFGTAYILLKMVWKPYNSRSESLYRSTIISHFILIALILIILPLISEQLEAALKFNEIFSKWAVIVTILIPPAYFLVIISYYIIYSGKKMD